MSFMTDEESLRKALMDYYGSGAYNGFPEMMGQVWEIEQMNEQELEALAAESGLRLF